MNTKLVTTYFPSHYNPPFWGKRSRDRWYAYSIISICGLGADTICYTDDRDNSYEFICDVKERHNLSNLTIKKFDLESSPFHERIYNIRLNNGEIYNNEFHPFYTLPIAIYWLKWHFLNLEYKDDTYLYWIDAGLSTGGLFPYIYNPYKDESGFKTKYHETGNHQEHAFKEFIFDKVFTSETMNRINTFVGDKILCVCRQDVMDNDYKLLEQKIQEPFSELVIQSNKFPVGAMFGGNTPYLKQYINIFHELAERILNRPEKDYLCTEQEIMGYIHVKYPEWFKDWTFNTFYHEEWDMWDPIEAEKGKLKPFHRLFTKELG
jgi:hypothetical protein